MKNKTKITVAQTAGFCFGVDRAVKLVSDLVEKGEKVCTLGPIIHNPQLVEELEKKGVVIINSPADAPDGYTVVIRSHGVGREVYDWHTSSPSGLLLVFCHQTLVLINVE